MAATTSDAQSALLAEADEYLVGGCLGVWRMPEGTAFVGVRGSGSHVWDAAGNEHIDYLMGNGPLILGHAAPAVVSAVQRQAALGSTFVTVSQPAIELGRTIVENVPCAELVRFAHSGTEATNLALRMARAFTGREKILKFEGGFIGQHDYGLQSVTPPVLSSYPESISDSLGIPASVGKEVLIAPYNDAEFARDLIEKRADELAAVIVEPIQRVIQPRPGFLEALREATRKFGVLLIFDEIVTGFRIAWGGAQERFGVIPDLATYSKAMTGGYNLAVVCGKREVMETADPRRQANRKWAYSGGTLVGNPLSCAASIAALGELRKPGTYERLHVIGARLRKGIEELGAARDIPVQVLGDDAFFQPVFTDLEIQDWAGMSRANLDLGRRFGTELLRRGLFATPNSKWYVSTTHTDRDIDTTLSIVEDAFGAL